MDLLVTSRSDTEIVASRLAERFAAIGFILMEPRDLGKLVANADRQIELLAYLSSKQDLRYWLHFTIGVGSVLVANWILRGVTMVDVVGEVVISVILSLVFQRFVARQKRRRTQHALKTIFKGMHHAASDQVGRVRVVSKWMGVIGQLTLEDGRVVMIASATSLKSPLFLVDRYRK